MRTSPYAFLAAVLATVPALLPAAPAATPACGIVPYGCEAWMVVHDGGRHEVAPRILAANGRVFVGSIQDAKAAVNAYDSTMGVRLWNISYADESGPEPHALAASPNGDQVFVIGTGFAGRITRMFLLAIDAEDGAIQWEAHWGLDTDGLDVWADGSTVYAVGSVRNNYSVVAYDAATGAQKWASYYDARGGWNPGWRGWSYDVAFDVAHAGSNLYVTGVSAAPDGLLEYATLAIDAATGAQLWVARSHGMNPDGSALRSEAYAVAASTDGSLVYVLGNDGLKAFDAATGEPAPGWSGHEDVARCRAYFPMLNKECLLAPTPDGRALIAMSHTDLAAYDARTGALLWHEVLHYGTDTNWSLTRTMVPSPDGSRVYVASPGGREDYVTDTLSSVNEVYETRAFDAIDGALLWRVTTRGERLAVEGIDVSPDGGHVFVTGEDPYHSNIVTVAYDTSQTTFPRLPL